MNTNHKNTFGWELAADADAAWADADAAWAAVRAAAWAAAADAAWAAAADAEAAWEAKGQQPSLKRLGLEVILRDIEANKAAKKAQDWQNQRLNAYEIMAVVWAAIIGSVVAIAEISGWIPQVLPSVLGGGQ